MKTCIICEKKVSDTNITGYCSECLHNKNQSDKIFKWLTTGDASIGVATTLRGCIREWIFENQNGQCAICGMESEWNGKPLHFVLDHIDGDASNNLRDNLRLICPNCDSQLETFKSRNKNSARTHRKS